MNTPATIRPPRAAFAALACLALVSGCVRPTQALRDPPKFGRASMAPAPVPLPAPVSVVAAPRGPKQMGFGEYAGSDTVYFAKDSADLSDNARSVLDRQADWLNVHPGVAAMLLGHADELGTREFRFALGERRASAMRFHLIVRGVSADRLKIASFGKELPVATGWGEQDQKANRRGQTVLVNAPAPAR